MCFYIGERFKIEECIIRNLPYKDAFYMGKKHLPYGL